MTVPAILRAPRPVAGLLALASALILGTALASQFLGGLSPCELCIYQRWPYVATILAGLAGYAVVRHRAAQRALIALCGLAFAIGGGIAVYHAGVELHWFAGPGACSGTAEGARTIEELRRQLLAAPLVRCDEPAFVLFGISMAGYNAIASIILAAASFAAAALSGGRGTA